MYRDPLAGPIRNLSAYVVHVTTTFRLRNNKKKVCSVSLRALPTWQRPWRHRCHWISSWYRASLCKL